MSTRNLSSQAMRTAEQPISYLMSLALVREGLISLAAGFVDYDTLPVTDVRESMDELLADPATARAALQYGTTIGLAGLRRLVLDRLVERENTTAEALSLTPDHVIVTSGSQQLLYLVSSVLIDPGDIVLLPRPTYFVYMGTLQIFGTRALGVETDDEGIRADDLDRRFTELEARGELGRVKMIYLCDYFDNPTGLTVSGPRRRQLMDVIRRWRAKQRFYVLEDAAYRDLVYDPGADLPTLKSMDPKNDLVILAQTFSKPLAPGLKTGYGFLPDDLAGPILDQKGSHDFGSANLCQFLAWRMLASGRADEHVLKLREAYRAKRDAMLDALDTEFGALRDAGLVRWTRPAGGLYVWLTLPEHVDTDLKATLFQRCLEAGVIYVPGSFCYCPEQGYTIPRNHMRLSFGVPSVEQNREGVRRLADVIRKELE